jgi:glycosyltransferase 2 family protein
MAKPPQSALGPSPRPFIGAGSFWRVAAGLALLALLYYWRIIDIETLGALLARPGILALAALAALANIPLEALRWHVLLRAQGLSLPFAQTTRVLAMSLFFANFLPGAAGGDLLRGAYLYRAARGRRTPALLSIAIDRLIGLVAFVLLGLLAMLARPAANSFALVLTVAAFSALFLATLVALFLFGHRIAQFLQRLLSGRSARLAQVIDDLGAALRQYARDWRSVALALLISAAIVVLAVGPIVLIAGAMRFGGLSALDYGIAGLYALIANSLPATPGGLGIGETAFASACAMLAPQAPYAAYGTIFLAFRCLFVISTLPGLAAYLIDPSLRGRGRLEPRISSG